MRRLVEFGLADDQEVAFQRKSGKRAEVVFPNAEYMSRTPKNLDYRKMYQLLLQERAYNVKMCDGALMQMTYQFSNRKLQRHRLAFFPAPHLEKFQNEPDTYLDDDLHGDVVDRSVVPFPLRYDYDSRESHPRPVGHPFSHLTIGQYDHCRIPVSAPITPHWFVDFIVRNLYHTAFRSYADEMPISKSVFSETIHPEEQQIIHVIVPRIAKT